MATMPSSRLQTSRSWIIAAATASSTGLGTGPSTPDTARHPPASAANTTLASEMVLGRTWRRASQAADAVAQRVWRDRSGRRIAYSPHRVSGASREEASNEPPPGETLLLRHALVALLADALQERRPLHRPKIAGPALAHRDRATLDV